MIDLKELKKMKKRNFEERLKFIDMWCEYIKNTPNRVWSTQQAELINSQIKKLANKKNWSQTSL
jgi:hypothetical protein